MTVRRSALALYLNGRRRALGRALKPLEELGRELLQWVMATLLWVAPRPVSLPAAPRILVVRLDRRVGNLVLLTPFLGSLRRTFPDGHITVLCDHGMAALLAEHPFVDALELYEKWPLLTRRGSFALIARLRRQRFDLAFDAGAFFGAAVTHPLITRLSGAAYTVGPRRPPLGRIYHHAVDMLPEHAPDIDQRLQLLRALPHAVKERRLCFVSEERLGAIIVREREFLRSAAPSGLGKTICLVVGTRLAERRVPPEAWAEAARVLAARGYAVTLLWGPGEESLARAIQAGCPSAVVAPPSSLEQAAALFRSVYAVIGHDTGTSHVAAAVGARLLVAFVVTEPERYAHHGSGQGYVDLRESPDRGAAFVAAVSYWLGPHRALPEPRN